jgi:hypothetical protein
VDRRLCAPDTLVLSLNVIWQLCQFVHVAHLDIFPSVYAGSVEVGHSRAITVAFEETD